MLLKLIVNGTHVSDLFQCQIKCMAFYIVSMFIMFPLIKLRNYMVLGQN